MAVRDGGRLSLKFATFTRTLLPSYNPYMRCIRSRRKLSMAEVQRLLRMISSTSVTQFGEEQYGGADIPDQLMNPTIARK